MALAQDIGNVRRALVHRALAARPQCPAPAAWESGDPRILRELLDEAHARIRALEKAIERLTAAM